MDTLTEISNALVAGRLPKIKPLVTQALDENIKAETILSDGLLAGMAIVGEKFKANQMYVPEVMLAAKCMQTGCDLLKPFLIGGEGSETANSPVVVIGTVKGDRHDIGKNLCKLMLEGRGMRVIDLGVNVPAEKFVTEAQKNGAKIICCSALLTTTMPEMKKVVIAVHEAGIDAKVMVGGAPVTQEFADSIGADAYTSDAASCAERAYQLATA